ncbi:MAG: hypothetical protein OXE52_13755, partial [Chloroflexi bacterium]|nr:hypothetical protein [Chloroflexota bacterium]
LMLAGESVWAVDGELTWVPSYSIDKSGNYTLDGGGVRSAEHVLHVRYAWDRFMGRGLGPLDGATRVREAGRKLERAFSFAGNAPVAQLARVPYQRLVNTQTGQESPNSPIDQLTRAIVEAEGKAYLAPASAAATGGASKDYELVQFAPHLPQENTTGWESLNKMALVSMGFPASYSRQGLTREDWRMFITTTLKPLGRLVIEAAARAGLPISISWNEVQATDLATRARAFKGFVDAGLTKEEAAEVCDIKL